MRVYLCYGGLPAHVFERGRGEACGACGSLLQEQHHTFRVLPQFTHQVLQLPAHLGTTREHNSLTMSSKWDNQEVRFEAVT